ncbi:MAG: DUF3299 domain-containing protein [Leadbetterella sp.]
MALFAFEPVKITWDTLKDVTYKKKWNPTESIFELAPNFGPKVLAIKGKEVSITGYMIPVDAEANYYVLSANPYAACFFCGQSGPESVVSIKFKKITKRYNTDDRVTITGIFNLNSSDINELTYYIENAQQVN